MIGVIIISRNFSAGPPHPREDAQPGGEGARMGGNASFTVSNWGGGDLNGLRGQRSAGSNAYQCDAGAIKLLFLMRSL